MLLSWITISCYLFKWGSFVASFDSEATLELKFCCFSGARFSTCFSINLLSGTDFCNLFAFTFAFLMICYVMTLDDFCLLFRPLSASLLLFWDENFYDCSNWSFWSLLISYFLLVLPTRLFFGLPLAFLMKTNPLAWSWKWSKLSELVGCWKLSSFVLVTSSALPERTGRSFEVSDSWWA